MILQEIVINILEAESRIYDLAVETPLDYVNFLSKKCGNSIYLKREDLQKVFSFKLRGAYNKILSLSNEERRRGVITASAGNHAQGVALASKHLGIHSLIVMPVTTPTIKVDAVREYGAEIKLVGDSYDDAARIARDIAAERNMTYIHSFDDLLVIAGQGTIAIECLRQCANKIDMIFVPVGGGGLISGIAAYIKFINPNTKIIAVEAEDSACLCASLQKNERVVLDVVGKFSDGIAVKQVGSSPFEIAKKLVDDTVTVGTDEICAAIKDIFRDTRSIPEPSGAVSTAGLKKYVLRHNIKEKVLIAVLSGANINFDGLRYVSERAEVGEKREVALLVTIPEEQGSYLKLVKDIGDRNFTEINYRYEQSELANIYMRLQIAEDESIDNVIKSIDGNVTAVVNITDDVVTGNHIRHMIGGRLNHARKEKIFRFEFPERVGALRSFLEKLSTFNISLFHYRNYGAEYSSVLVGLFVSENDSTRLLGYIKSIGYRYWDESDNFAFKKLLK